MFLTLDEVIAIHRDQIERYGGSEGVRDMGLLESALAMPSAGFGGEFAHVGLHEMAAAYLFYLVMNHPFVDGNKRVAAATADVFLALNGLYLTATEDDYVTIVLDVVQGTSTKLEVSGFFRCHCTASE